MRLGYSPLHGKDDLHLVTLAPCRTDGIDSRHFQRNLKVMITLAVVLLTSLPMLILMGAVFLQLWWLERSPRRDPLTSELRHLPGASTQARREEGIEDVVTKMAWIAMIGWILSVVMLQRLVPETGWIWKTMDTINLIVGLSATVVLTWRIVRKVPDLRGMKQGVRAEQASAQELSEVLAGNNRIVHDIGAKDFNIDHVVITPAGIFAVETKSRLKPPSGSGTDAVKVAYDGTALSFPGWVETAPIEQARRQADWLSRHLKAATGETFPVFPVLALPGWYVENTARITDNMVRVINPKNSAWLFVKRPRILEDAAVQRAIFCIEKLATQASARG